jgi:hypothetical protein
MALSSSLKFCAGYGQLPMYSRADRAHGVEGGGGHFLEGGLVVLQIVEPAIEHFGYAQ